MNKYIQDMLDRQAYIDQNMQQKDPFDKGIMRAVSSAKQSLGMDEEQSDRALRNSLLSFSDALYQDQTPMEKGFMGKFAALGRAMNPALRTHDQYEDLAQNENMQLAKEAQNFRTMEEAKMAKMEQDAYMREMNDQKMALEQEKLAELRDYHNQSLLAKLAKATEKKETPFDKKHKLGLEGVKRTIDNAVTTINKNQALAEATGEDSKGEAGLIKRLSNGIGLTQFTPEQEEIETLGSLLAGYSNKLMNYNNQVEFESLPHISPYKSDANNLAILQKMQEIMLRDAEEAGLDLGKTNKNDMPKVRLYDPNTNQYFGVPADEVELAIKDHPQLIRE